MDVEGRLCYLLINPCIVQGSSVVQLYKNIFHLCTRHKLDGLFDIFVLCTDEEEHKRSYFAQSFFSLSPIGQDKSPEDRLTRVKDQESRE